MLICEMAAYYRSIGSSIKERLEEIYKEYGRYLNKVDSFEFPGLTGMEKMASIMQKLRDEPLTELAGHKVVKITDYKKPEETGLPAANVLIYTLDNGATVVVRPSGTEPKIKTYFTTLGKDLAEAQAQKDALAAAIEPILASRRNFIKNLCPRTAPKVLHGGIFDGRGQLQFVGGYAIIFNE